MLIFFYNNFTVYYAYVYFFPGEIGGFQREETQDIIRDIDWSTRNVMLGYDVAGPDSRNFSCSLQP